MKTINIVYEKYSNAILIFKMGAASSIQTIEVSFIDKNTGKLLTEKEINKINDDVFQDFKYGFYKRYTERNAYEEYGKQLSKQGIK